MATTRTTVDAIKRKVRDDYRSGIEIGLVHAEAVERAVQLNPGAASRGAIEEWLAVEHDRRREAGF
jgi:hypothetical protein